MMDRRMCVLISLFAVVAIALPQCATQPRFEPARVEPARAEPAKVVGADEQEIAPSAPVGSVYRVNPGNREVLVRTKRILRMGERVYAEVGEEKAMMTATFPMLTSSKCTLEAGSRKYFGRLSKGMPVYLYVPGEKKMAGTWTGYVDRQGFVSHNMVTMNITYMKNGKLSGSIEYPDLGCGGTLTYKDAKNDSIVFTEKITYGDRCADNGEISVSLNNQGKLKWNRTHRRTRERASAVLSRMQESSYGVGLRFKSRSEFTSDLEYGEYVKSTIQVGMKVRAIVNYESVKSGYNGVYYGTNQLNPPCFVIWDRDLGSNVTWVPGVPETRRSWAYWVEWHHVQILE